MKDVVTVSVPYSSLPGFEWSDKFKDEDHIRREISDDFTFTGAGWYSCANGEVSLLIVADDGGIEFYHFNSDPRKYQIHISIPDFSYPDRIVAAESDMDNADEDRHEIEATRDNIITKES